MNPLYDQIFNQQYVNPNYLLQLQQQQYHAEQQIEIQKAVKALHDYCDTARKIKIAPEYRQQAFCVCVAAKGIHLETVVGYRERKQDKIWIS